MPKVKKKPEKKPAATAPPVVAPILSPVKIFTVVHLPSQKRVKISLDTVKERQPERRAMHEALIELQTGWVGSDYPSFVNCRLDEDGKLIEVPY